MRNMEKVSLFRKKKLSYVIVLCLLLLLACIIGACSKTEEAVSEKEEYVYLSEVIARLTGYSSPGNFRVGDGYLYFVIDSELYRVPMEEELSFSKKKLVAGKSGGAIIVGYTLSEEGDIYRFAQKISYSKDWQTVYKGGTLVRQTAEGNKVYELPLPDANTMMNCMPCLAVDGEGRAFLLTEDGICVIDAEGNMLTTISIEDCRPQGVFGKAQLLEGEAGSIYYLVTDISEHSNFLYEITGDNVLQLVKRDDIIKDMDDISSDFYSGGWGCGLMCSNNDGNLYRYSEADASWYKVLRFQDSNLLRDVDEIVWVTPDTMLAFYSSFGIKSQPTLFLLTKTLASEVSQREELVLATTGSWSRLSEYVATYNWENDRYHITIDNYEGEEGLLRLNSALVSDNPPDLLDLGDLSLLKYSEKQVLADLTPYLESSDVLRREDFLENILEGYTIDGKLYCIPRSFSFMSVMGRSSQVGDATGWTMEDVMAMTEKYPDNRLLDHNNFEYVLHYFCREYILEHFIDWETGSCSFNSQEFIDLMVWIQNHTKNIYLSYDENEDHLYGAVPEDMLLVRNQILSVRSFALLPYDWDQPITPVGCPTIDGRSWFSTYVYEALCITSGSDNPEGAWEFIEYLLSKKVDSAFTFTSRKDFLYQAVEEETVPLYIRDENGEIVVYEHFVRLENGVSVDHYNEPMMLVRSTVTVNGERQEYYYMEQESADTLIGIIESLDFSPDSELDDKVMAIIMEEIAPCLSGDKELETAVGIIQNRVQIMIQERL